MRRLRLAGLILGASLALPTAASADIVVADQDAFGGSGGLIRVDPATGARTTISENTSPLGGPDFANPSDVVLAGNGDLLVVDTQAFAGAGGGVIRVNPVTGARTTVSENSSPSGGPSFVDPFGIALAANGDILVADQNAFGGGGGVIRVDPVSGARTTVTQNAAPPGPPAFDAPWGIIEEANGSILVADAGAFAGGGGVIRVDPATGARTTLSANGIPSGGPDFSDPIQLELAPNGDVLVTDSEAFGSGGGVIRVDPATGARTTVSENATPPGDPSFVGPIGIVLEANGDILVSGFTNLGSFGGVTRVNPLTGARSTVSENSSPSGDPTFSFPSGILVEPEIVVPPDGAGPAPAAVPPRRLDDLPRLTNSDVGRIANVAPTSGQVLVGIPAGLAGASTGARTSQKGVVFVPLTEARQIPIGSFLDTRRGTVRLRSATGSRNRTQTGDFGGGLFQTLQSRRRSARGLTTLALKGASFRSCRRGGRGKRAGAAQSRIRRRLRANARGRFRTRGRHSAATVRGTVWLTADRCDGTLTRVTRGRVAVRDFRRRKTIVVRAGKSYLARAPR
jgi:hypothetical protein